MIMVIVRDICRFSSCTGRKWEIMKSTLLSYLSQVLPGINRISKIFLMGNSSGGHIAMMSVLFNAHGLCNTLPQISGVICESGSTDLLICAEKELPPWMKVRPSAVLLGVDEIKSHEELAEKASCSMYITENIELPPILLIHSENDPIVSVANSRILHEKLVASHHNVSYYELEGNDAHGGATYYDKEILDIIQEFCRKCVTL